MTGTPANARLAAVAILAVAAGCQNPSATLVGAGDAPLPDLADSPEPLAREGGPATLGADASTPAGEAPRTTALDRGNWPATTVRQPRGQVEVQPTYHSLFEGFSGDPRATGRFPTSADALAIHGEGPSAPADGAAQPAIGIFWLASMPFHAVLVPPNAVRREPAGAVEWLPAQQAPAGRP